MAIDYAELVMESFVEIIDKLATQNRIKKGELAAKVWPDMQPRMASRKWQFIRKKSYTTGQPQGILLSDAYRLAAALDQDPAYILMKASGTAEDKWNKLQAASAAKPKMKAKK
ncbi:immunity protein [Deltaproteobacteria bacterium Smac51]|nr:immunity protein [Deltaproteobacteria bacterium Smac51]